MNKKSMSYTVFSLVVLILPPCSSANTIAQAISEMLHSHPMIKMARSNLHSGIEERKAAVSGFLPTLDVRLEGGTETIGAPNSQGGQRENRTLKPSQGKVQLNQALYKGMATTRRVQGKDQLVDSRRFYLRQTAESLAVEVVSSFLEVLEQGELVKLSEKNLSAHRRIHQLVAQRVGSGADNRTDLTQIEGRLARSEANLINTKSQLQEAQSRYYRLINSAPGDQLVAPKESEITLPPTLGEAIATALQDSPAVNAEVHSVNAARHLYEETASAFMPVVDLLLEHGSETDNGTIPGKRSSTSAVIQLNYNAFRGGHDRAKRRSAAFALEENRALLHDVQRRVVESISIAWSNMESLSESQPLLKKHRDTCEKTVKSYKQQYELGKRTLLELLDSENESFQANRAFLHAHYRGVFSRYSVVGSMGHLLKQLDIVLEE